MNVIVDVWKTVRHYKSDSDFFVLVDQFTDLCGFYPPKWNPLALAAWVVLKVGQVVQYTFYAYHCYQSAVNGRNILYFALNINLFVILSVGLFRTLTLAYYQQQLQEVKSFVNSRQCAKEDAKANYSRGIQFWTNNRLLLGGFTMLVLNAANWCLTAAFTEDLYQIPFSLQFLPKAVEIVLVYYYSFQMLIQNLTYWQSFFQFGFLLSLLRIELTIVSEYFESIFDRAFQVCCGDDLELQYANSLVASKIWRTTRIDLNLAATYYSSLVNHVEILKQVTYINFLALLLATAVLVTLNSFLCVIDFSRDALGLLVFGAMCAMECFFTCRLLDELDDVNEEIAMNAYSMDWMTSITLPRGNLDDYRSIKSTALIVLAQARRGFRFQAGGMYDMNSEMFIQIMQMCYSWIAFLMQTQMLD